MLKIVSLSGQRLNRFLRIEQIRIFKKIYHIHMQTSEFDYHLPSKLIAQQLVFPRDHSKLMVLDREKQTITHDYFYNLPHHLNTNDVLVFNNSKVIPARIFGAKNTGGKMEVLLLKPLQGNYWECLTKPGGKIDQVITFSYNLNGKIVDILATGLRIIELNIKGKELERVLNEIGIMPTPPYIKRRITNQKEYQTVYAKNNGSVAAPTAGFHFTKNLLQKLNEKEIKTEFLTLHVGLGTFQPVKTEIIEHHLMHSEWFSLSKPLAKRLNTYKKQGKRIISVGTTTTRALESTISLKRGRHQIEPFAGETTLFIYPGYQFKFINALITNFHLPKSTLLMLVSAFTGREFILRAYEEAIKQNYRFYSFGDGMLIV